MKKIVSFRISDTLKKVIELSLQDIEENKKEIEILIEDLTYSELSRFAFSSICKELPPHISEELTKLMDQEIINMMPRRGCVIN